MKRMREMTMAMMEVTKRIRLRFSPHCVLPACRRCDIYTHPVCGAFV
jgi:hypothetical protein